MNNSIMDILSSPDPLNESLQGLIAPSSARRVTRSQTPHKFFSLESSTRRRETSPRKQTFELDVGNEDSPQKILVTVEAEETGARAVNRRLFTSPAPSNHGKRSARKQQPTTTKVPLKGIDDDEGVRLDDAPTPKRRGRPPRAATPTADRKARRATPTAKKTPGPGRTRTNARANAQSSELPVDADEATPKPSSAATRSVKRRAPTPAAGEQSVGGTEKRNRGRPRRTALPPEELIGIVAKVSAAASRSSVAVSDDMPLVVGEEHRLHSERASDHEDGDIWIEMSNEEHSPANEEPVAASETGDIWMQTLSDGPVSEAPRSASKHASVSSAMEGVEDNVPAPLQTAIEVQHEVGDIEAMAELPSAPIADSHMRDTIQHVPTDQESVMDGEDFTMISLPSLQGNASMPPADDLPEIGEATSLIISRTLEALRQEREHGHLQEQGQDVAEDGPVDSELERPTEAVNTDPSTMSKTRDFSSMFTLTASANSRAKSPRRAKLQNLSRQVALRSLQDSPARMPGNEVWLARAEVSVLENQGATDYDDSFSEIPDDVFDAVTPKKPSQAVLLPHSHRADGTKLVPIRSRSGSRGSQGEGSGRLPTPDETPSPTYSEDVSTAEHAAGPETYMPSSPPGLVNQRLSGENGSPRRSSRNASLTPAGQIRQAKSSPAAPEIEHVAGGSLLSIDQPTRLVLSPIVRAGRSLQRALSDPPSPPQYNGVLGSPFRPSSAGSAGSASASADNQIPTKSQDSLQREITSALSDATVTNIPLAPETAKSTEQPQRNWSQAFAPFSSIRSLVAQGAQVFSPLGRPSPQPDVEDPFAVGKVMAIAQPLAADMAVEVDQGHFAMTGKARPSSGEMTIDEEMSWAADADGAQANARLLCGKEKNGASPNAASRREVPSLAQSEIVSLDTLHKEEQLERDYEEGAEENNDEDDIWGVEATRSSPVKASQPATAFKDHDTQRGRPAMWKRSQGLAASKPSFARSVARKNTPRASDVSEYSLLSVGDDSNIGGAPSSSATKPVPGGLFRGKLAAFFSSPSVQANDVSSPPKRPSLLGLPVSRGLANFADQSDDIDHDVLALGTGPVHSDELSRGLAPSSPTRSSPVRPAAAVVPMEVDQLSSPATSAPVTLPAQIPQKMNFTPRARQAGSSLFSLFTKPAAAVEQEVRVMEDVHNSSVLEDESSFEAPILKALPDRAMTPSKSCIRSPLKPKTPGRVVEFTTSTLSPLAQAQARSGEQAEVHAVAPAMIELNTDGNKENVHDNASFSSDAMSKASTKFFGSSPMTKPVLSQTQWSRAHWLRLDELLQERRSGGALQFQLRHTAAMTPRARKGAANAKIGSAPLLGKRIMSQGESMRIEQWHLDVVDAFRGEVGGWDSGLLAKRLFSLIVGEERRGLRA
jgi:serine/arginine repetitive matrix protein 2